MSTIGLIVHTAGSVSNRAMWAKVSTEDAVILRTTPRHIGRIGREDIVMNRPFHWEFPEFIGGVRRMGSYPPDAEGSVTHVFRKLRAGDHSAAQKLWDHFLPRMVALARKTLSDGPQKVADADDAVQSAFFNFWQRAQRGIFTGDLHRDNLWNLLAVITVRKAKKQIRRELAGKRGGGEVLGGSAVDDAVDFRSQSFRLDEALGQIPMPIFDLNCEELLLKLDEELRALALLRLKGHTNGEIADILDCTQRTVERKLKLIRLRWEHELET